MNVFATGVLLLGGRSALSGRGRLKGFGHGWKQAFTPNTPICEACGKHVEACPEEAIPLVRA